MKNLFRFSLCASLLSALLVGGSYACPRLTSQLGLNLAELIDLQKQIVESQRRGEELDQLSKFAYQAVLKREQVMDEMREHKLDLVGAAARFRDITRGLPPAHRRFLQDAYPCPTIEESYCRQVVYYLRGEAIDHPEVGPTADAMEAELNRRLQNGPIDLPESQPAPPCFSRETSRE